MGKPGRLAVLCEEHGIPWRLVPLPWVAGRIDRPTSLGAFAWQLRRARPDIILPYMEMPNLVCGLVWRWTGAGTCVWNQRDDGIARISTRYEPWAIRLTPRFISNSAGGAEHLVQDRSVPRDLVSTIYNGVELSLPNESRDDWRNRLGLGDGCFAACMVANLTAYKDHATLLRAWKLVVEGLGKTGRRAVLLLAGRPDANYESVGTLAVELGIKDNVVFLGPVADVSGLLTAVEAGILCSNSEGSPNSVLEYMAAGLAVAGTDIPAMREVLTEENHELLAPITDAGALAERVMRLAEDQELRTRLGALNRSRIKMKFGPNRMCEETIAVILSSLKGKRRRGGSSRHA
jgi:glycosyltransferase involved in cell wall biosynthesis